MVPFHDGPTISIKRLNYIDIHANRYYIKHIEVKE